MAFKTSASSGAYAGKDVSKTKEGTQDENRQPTYMDELRDGGRVFNLHDHAVDTVIRIRLLGNILPLRRHWITTKNNKVFPLICSRWDPEAERMDDETHEWHCLACAFLPAKRSKPSVADVINMINRELQDSGAADPIQLLWLNWYNVKELNKAMNRIKGRKPTGKKKGYDLELTVGLDQTSRKNVSIALCPAGSEPDPNCALTEEECEYELIDLGKVYAALIPGTHNAKTTTGDYRDTLISMFANGYVPFKLVPEIVDWATAANLMTKDQVDPTLKAVHTIHKKPDYHFVGDEDEDSEETEETPPKRKKKSSKSSKKSSKSGKKITKKSDKKKKKKKTSLAPATPGGVLPGLEDDDD